MVVIIISWIFFLFWSLRLNFHVFVLDTMSSTVPTFVRGTKTKIPLVVMPDVNYPGSGKNTEQGYFFPKNFTPSPYPELDEYMRVITTVQPNFKI